MAVVNLALNKTATASSYVQPYAPSRAVDGSVAQTSRWISNRVPCYMVVDLGAQFWIDRWVVRHMGAAGWSSPNYNMVDYSFQGSNDGVNWINLDCVTGNSVPITDRTFQAKSFQYVMLNVTKGINVNKGLASCVEFEVYEAQASSSNLTSLTISQGVLVPNFTPLVTNYTATVDNDVTSITITPIPEDPQATVAVNGTVLAAGATSVPIQLNVGLNTIHVLVTSKIGGVQKDYVLAVTRSANLYLSELKLDYTGRGSYSVEHTITSNHSETKYSDTIDKGAISVSLVPCAEDASVVIKVNGVVVPSNTASASVRLTATTTFTIVVTPADPNSTEARSYSLSITKSS